LIAAADICLLPAYTSEKIMRDIVPIKLYEYMAIAKPVISTNLPGVRREFGEGNGVVYVERPEDVVPKAIELVKSGQLAELGQKARRFVKKNSWDKVTDEFEALLEEVICEKRSARPVQVSGQKGKMEGKEGRDGENTGHRRAGVYRF
ncbi:MAG: glycosyltransferase, partial [Clostridia bacterium]|nr:glycosyltransferase [Clostridia bacterium]